MDGVYGELAGLCAHFHAVLDYPDEDIDPFEAEELSSALGRAAQGLDALAATYRRGRLLNEGVPCAIVGRPNAGVGGGGGLGVDQAGHRLGAGQVQLPVQKRPPGELPRQGPPGPGGKPGPERPQSGAPRFEF